MITKEPFLRNLWATSCNVGSRQNHLEDFEVIVGEPNLEPQPQPGKKYEKYDSWKANTPWDMLKKKNRCRVVPVSQPVPTYSG